jgi:protein-disulfide isomerase
MAAGKNSSVLAARQRANELRREEAKTLRRRRALVQTGVIGGTIVVLAAIAASIVFGARTAGEVAKPTSPSDTSIPELSGTSLTIGPDYVRLGAEDARITLSLYEDFSCPHCQDYEAAIGATLDDLVATGDVAVQYHPIRIVTSYGNRAGSAATCVAEGQPTRWSDVHASLFTLHDVTTDSWSNARLRDHLVEEGISDEATLECIAEGRYENWIDANTAAAREAGATSTPKLMINGEPSETLDAPALLRTVEQLLAEG